jgi:hypothetical protein
MNKRNDGPLPESKELLNALLTKTQKEIVEKAMQEIKENPESYNIDFFWGLDASIGGVGGYCMPFDVTRNPFPTGIGRSLFRPLQYAASDIEMGKDIYFHARHVVQDAGLHLEMVTGFVLWKTSNRIGKISLPFKKWTLGQSISELEKRKVLPQHLIGPLNLFKELYNKSKHDVNQDEERERLFSPADALIAYISARILGKELLRPYYKEILEQIRKDIEKLNCAGVNF